MDRVVHRRLARASLPGALLIAVVSCFAQQPSPLGWDPYFTFAGNFDFGYHNTQFFAPNENVVVGQWNSRAEIWLPPFRDDFSWGPYVSATGIAATKSEAWQNAWLAEPGVGFQMYPFSLPRFRNSSSKLGKIFGPTRLFAEYNPLNYWGAENSWRPRKQTRYGAEYWRSLHVNDTASVWWAEVWNGLWWQSANEFAPRYDTVIFANAVRSGVRAPKEGVLAILTPYVAFESSRTDNPTYYWENKLDAGGGFRIAPAIGGKFQDRTRVNRFAIYAEYLHVFTYYGSAATAQANLMRPPDHEVRIGITFSTGLWYY
jgi:hypothetical protein